MSRSEELERIAAEVRACTRCRLHEGRRKAVPGEGPSKAAIFLVGEAPGQKEDAAGRPFVGRAGKLLDRALREAGLRRWELFITNVVKCRPPDNRDPKADEIEACRPYLLRQIECVDPAVIVTLGAYGLRSLLQLKGSLEDHRGRELEFQERPVVATYHPAALRFGRARRKALVEDLRRAAEIAGRD
jgi:DNA polymerase